MPPSVFFVAIVPVLIESLLLLVRPQWLTPLAFWRLREHRFTLGARRREPDLRAGYRDRAEREPTLPALPARTELSDSILFASGAQVALRRAYGLGRRQVWLVGITIARSGDEIVLGAKQAIVPMSLPLFVLAFVAGVELSGAQLSLAPTLVVAPIVLLLALALQHVFTRASRDEQLDEAFSFLEDALRRALDARPGDR